MFEKDDNLNKYYCISFPKDFKVEKLLEKED